MVNKLRLPITLTPEKPDQSQQVSGELVGKGEVPMKPRLARPTIAILALAALFGSGSRPAVAQAPKPGTIVTVAGAAEASFAGDGGPATQARLFLPHRVSFDAAGNLYIPDLFNHRIRKISPDGIITTVAGSTPAGDTAPTGDLAGDGGPATQAHLRKPQDVVFDTAGNMFILDSANNRVRKIAPDGIISTVVGAGPLGDGKGGYQGDGGPALQAWINRAAGLAMDAANNLYIADTDNFRVRKVTPDGVITTFAGNGTKGRSGDGGPATQASLTDPHGLAFDAAGNLYVTDFAENVVRKVTPGGIITTVAGNGTGGFSGDGGPATAAQLNRPHGVALDSAGNMFIADTFNYRVRKVTPDGIITTVAGVGAKLFAEEGGLATTAGLRGPMGVAVDREGNLLISDTGFFADRVTKDGLGLGERVFKVFGVAAPGLLNGRSFPNR